MMDSQIPHSHGQVPAHTGDKAVSAHTGVSFITRHDTLISAHFLLYPGYGGGGEFVSLGGVGVYGGGRRSGGYIS